MSFELEILPDGNLKLKIVQDNEEEDRDWDKLIKQPNDDALWSLLEDGRYIGNGWTMVDADKIGAMTEAPMICDDYSVEDDDDYVVYGSVWWFPNYMVEDPIETLRDKGEVIFKLGHKPGELVPKKWLWKFDPNVSRFPVVQPHGLCKESKICQEHAKNKKVKSCKGRRGRGRRVP